MTMMAGKEALMTLLKNEGVEYVFGIPGATEVLFMDALEKHPDMKYILGLQEVVVAGMAEGYSRVSGKPGFLNLHTGTGLGAAIPMLLNASQGGVPLVVTAGQQDNHLLLKDPHLAGDLVSTASLFAKWYAEITYAEEIPVAIQRAFKMAMQPPTGPVFLSLPQNILDQDIDFDYLPSGPFFNELRPDLKAVNKAAECLTNCRAPVIFVESGVTRSKALAEVVNLAELIGARVTQPWMSDVNFPVQHPQYAGDTDFSNPQIRNMLESADVMIWIGCPQFSSPFQQPRHISLKNTTIIQIDDNPWEIGKNFPVDVGIQGNIKASLEELIALLGQNMSTEAMESARARIGEMTREHEGILETAKKQDQEEKDNVPISISRLMNELKDAVRPDTIIVDDCWSSSGALRSTLDFAESGSFHRARRGGSIGWGLPGALGIKLAAPDRPVVAVSGDGSAMWSIQSLWTAAHYRIPVTFIITANATYRQVKLMRNIRLGGEVDERHAGMELDDPVIDFCKLAESMGVRGDSVTQPDDLKKTLKAAFDSSEPRLIEVVV
ncbi:MAG: thiamine pyrophosphate-binding protein [Deltaproteobacteria bacterium]|nr:thiamine pyrophosphate-binding protein [Deltaproteobacteria bacterium]